MQGARIALILVFLLAPLFASQLQLVSPAPDAAVSEEGVFLSFIATGGFSDSFSCTININGLSFEGIEALNGTRTDAYLAPLLSETGYTWNVACSGPGENLESETRMFSTKASAQEKSLISPPEKNPGISAQGKYSADSATGGTITYVDGYTIHTFTSSGIFNVTGSGNVEVLVVAGGGGAGDGEGGGGGAGGVVYNSSYAVTSGAKTVTVGNGGAGEIWITTAAQNGQNSVFDSITAIGGGRGGSMYFTQNGGNGGSGGGASPNSNTGGSPTSGQGNAGGGSGTQASPYIGGGGGGAGAVGNNGSGLGGDGNGGIGKNYSQFSDSGSPAGWFAGGGGGGGHPSGGAGICAQGGTGGGGKGYHDAAGDNGIANTGGGGGGAGNIGDVNGGNGGSGIVIIRYLTAAAPNVSINSPSNGATLASSLVTLNWTPSNFISNPTCNVSRNSTIIYSGACASNQSCSTTNATPEGSYSWGVACYNADEATTSETRSFAVALNNIIPSANNFSTAYGTTDFSAVPDLGNAINLTLATSSGKINFAENYGVDANGQDYDSFVNISSGFISVDSSGLSPTFNHSATLTLNNATCPATVYYASGVFNSKAGILAQNKACNSTTNPGCTGITCSGGNLTFIVSHFTGFAYATTANLTIWDETDSGMPYGGQFRYMNQQVKFFANYTDSSGPLDNADCSVWFSDSNWSAMAWNASGFYEYNRSFASPGAHGWNASCAKPGYDSLNTNSSAAISYPPVVSGNSPANGATIEYHLVTLNWTPYNFTSNPKCNVTRNNTVIFSGTCTNGQACTTTNATANGAYLWNATCYNSNGTAVSETRDFTVLAPSVTLNSPVAGALIDTTYSLKMNWTPSNFSFAPTCNLTRNGTVVFSGACNNDEPCTTTKTTTNGFYVWNVTCYADSQSFTAGTRNFTVDVPIISISLDDDAINFGIVLPDSAYLSNNTGDYFLIRNDGNRPLDIEAGATGIFSSLTTCTSLPCNNYQIMGGPGASVSYPACAQPGNTLTEYANLFGISAPGLLFNDLNHVDGNNTAKIYVKLGLPSDEPPGEKNSTITFWAKAGDTYPCD